MSGLDHFRPRTPTEMMLHNEVKRLRRENLELMHTKRVNPFEARARETLDVGADFPPELRMLLTARVLGQIDEQGRLSVDATCYAKGGKLGFAYYLSPHDIADVNYVADILLAKHEELIHAVADELTKQNSRPNLADASP